MDAMTFELPGAVAVKEVQVMHDPIQRCALRWPGFVSIPAISGRVRARRRGGLQEEGHAGTDSIG